MAKRRSVTPDGDAIRTARLKKAWSTDDLARHTDCVVKTIENAERGQSIYANTLARIAKALAVDYDALLAKKTLERKPTKLDHIISTTRVEVDFGILARETQPIDADWFIEQLRRHVSFQDALALGVKEYLHAFATPEGGVWIRLTMTVRDYRQVYACFAARNNPDEPFLKVAFLGAEFIQNPSLHNAYLWVPPTLWYKPPHSHLYD